MNDMGKKPPAARKKDHRKHEEARLIAFADTVGDFIRYWGFRRIHGQLWALVYLSQSDLSGAELTRLLGVSKALVSPALGELEEHGLINSVPDGKKTKRYRANTDVLGVIKGVLEKREIRLLSSAREAFDALGAAQARPSETPSAVRAERLEEVGKMIASAELAIQFVLLQVRQ